ncbi:hypothetical protein H8356DRAFT_1438200 [Neocallimastix lanati (nom. inval.)]|nr:hypothetical protein H8356DRAFT_1438200 [Neocallimastix sp. JGI-2020a]
MEKNLEIEISKTNRGKEQIILNRKYKFNLSSKRKDNSKNINNQILKYDDSHNHLENKFGAAKLIVKIKLKMKFQKVQFLLMYGSLYCPGYNSIKSQVTRRMKILVIFKNNDLIVFQSTSVSNAAQKVFIMQILNTVLWHFKRALEIKKKELCGDKENCWNLRNKKQKKLIRTEEIKALESVRNDFIDLWLKCLNDLNIKIID